MLTETQISSGGVAYRREQGETEVALVLVGPKRRWQLPKGLVEADEEPALAAQREVREEAGLETELVAPLETIEYWYVATRGAERVRYHKFVHFYLFACTGGDVEQHDHEVLQARWFPIAAAQEALAFPNERKVVAEAEALLRSEG